MIAHNSHINSEILKFIKMEKCYTLFVVGYLFNFKMCSRGNHFNSKKKNQCEKICVATVAIC